MMRKTLIVIGILSYIIISTSLIYVEQRLSLELINELNNQTPLIAPEEIATPYPISETSYIDEKNVSPKVDSIIEKYENQFSQLKNETLTDIENIKRDVLKELDGEINPLTLGMTIIKYEKKAELLEKQIDEKFNKLFDSYLSELKQHDYSTLPVSRLERQYKNIKRQIKSDLVQEANAWIEEQKGV